MHDVIIIGGGPAGAMAALGLARTGWSVALLERCEFPRPKVCGEFISAPTLHLIRDLERGEGLLRCAGPPVHRVAVFSGERVIDAPMPRLPSPLDPWGRAILREDLDLGILRSASTHGAEIHQPWEMTGLKGEPGSFKVEAIQRRSGNRMELRSRLVIAAHGSFDARSWLTPPRTTAQDSDLVAFKCHFRNASLPRDLMPLLAFPCGYGGMVSVPEDQVSVSLCIQRGVINRHGERSDGSSAAQIAWHHVLSHCRGAREILCDAHPSGPWQGAAPIRPGVRTLFSNGIFRVGNAAAESHPVIAEGISMALQGSVLLTSILCARSAGDWARRDLSEVARSYERAWRRQFESRIRTSSWIARWAMSSRLQNISASLLRWCPWILTAAARASGKSYQGGSGSAGNSPTLQSQCIEA